MGDGYFYYIFEHLLILKNISFSKVIVAYLEHLCTEAILIVRLANPSCLNENVWKLLGLSIAFINIYL